MQPYDYLMVYLSDLNHTSQSILPIHRFVSGLDLKTIKNLLPALEEKFEVERLNGAGEKRGPAMIAALAGADRNRNSFGMYLSGENSFFLLTGRQPRPMIDENDDKSAAYRALDIAVLDQVILAGILGIGIGTGADNENAKVRFVERTEKALVEISEPDYDVAFFVNPTSMEEIKAVADAGEKMPRKSTYFYPKPVTGLVFHSFDY